MAKRSQKQIKEWWEEDWAMPVMFPLAVLAGNAVWKMYKENKAKRDMLIAAMRRRLPEPAPRRDQR